MIEASAPGKLVLSGEYAVLAGAPALVAAVDRRVTCTLSSRDQGGWRFSSIGYKDEVTLTKEAVFGAPTASLPGLVRQNHRRGGSAGPPRRAGRFHAMLSTRREARRGL